MSGNERPCPPCPWVSQDPRDVAATSEPSTRAAMQAGAWFCCHMNMGTCHGARLLYERHVRQTAMEAKS